jgi:hypothetical protein
MEEPDKSGPYAPPQSKVSDAVGAKVRARAERWMFGIGLVSALGTAAFLSVLVPKFAQVFVEFGVDVPWAPALRVRVYPAAWLLPAVVLGVWLRWRRREHRGLIACAIGVGGALTLFPILIVALYLPIFHIAATI